MIQRAIFTWCSNPAHDGELPKSHWPSVQAHRWSWELATEMAARHFSERVLYTDSAGARNLGDLPYWTDVVVWDEGWPDPVLWGVAKLRAQAVQEQPFLHMDGDFFLWDFPDAARVAPAVVQGVEIGSPWYHEVAREAKRVGLAPHTPLWPLNRVVNVGIVGGCRLPALRAYAEHGFLNGPKALALGRAQGFSRPISEKHWNFFFEQYQLRQYVPPADTFSLGSGREFLHHPRYTHAISTFRKNPDCWQAIVSGSEKHKVRTPLPDGVEAWCEGERTPKNEDEV